MASERPHWTKLGNWERLDSGVLVCKGDAPLVKKRLPIRLGVGIKVLDDEQRVIRVTINTEQRDRDKDYVQPAGGITVEYEENPVVFWGHESWSFPIGNSVKLKKELRGVDRKHIWSDARFAGNKQQHGFAETAYLLTRDGFIHAASIGFIPLQYVENKPDAADGQDGALLYNGYNIQKWLLLEWSLVGIPSNPGALVQQNGYEPSKDWPVQRVMDVARKFLTGSDLDSFRKGIIGAPEVIECSSCGVYEKSASTTEPVPARAFASNAEEDLGFDHWERVLGRPCPDEGTPIPAKTATAKGAAKSFAPESVGRPAEKRADPEPEPGDDDPPVAPVVEAMNQRQAREFAAHDAAIAKQLDEATASALETRLSALAGSIGALAGILEASVSRLTAACASMEACCARMESAAEPPEPDEGDAPMTMASFAAEVRKGLVDTRRYVEDSYVTIWKQVEADKASALNTKSCGCTKAAPASSEATADPAPVAKDAEPAGSAAAPPNPAMDAGLMERVLRAGFTAGREKHLGIVRI